MEEKELYKMIEAHEGYVARSFPVLMRKVYVWMTLALVITAFTAYGVANSPNILLTIFSNRILFWGLIITELIIVFCISAAINRLSLTTATLLFVLYSVINGATLSVIFVIFSPTVITKTFLITAGTFAIMSFIGFRTKTDLSSVGRLLIMALVGLIIACVVNMFLKSSTFDYVISIIGVLIFVGLTAYDTQKIKTLLAQNDTPDEGMQKIALLGALSLYLDFINLFLYLLRFFGRGDD